MEVSAKHEKEKRELPPEWKVKKLGDLASFRTGPFGIALHKSDYVTDGIPCSFSPSAPKPSPATFSHSTTWPSPGSAITRQAPPCWAFRTLGATR